MKREWIGATCLAAAVLILRLVVAFSTNGFAADESYFHLRQAEHIQQHGIPLFDDPLSYGGSTTLFAPAFDYLVAALGFVVGVPIAAKLITNALAASLVLLVFAIALQMTRDRRAALIAAFAAGFIPVLWQSATTSAPHLFGVAMGFLMLLAFLKIDDPRWRVVFLSALVIGTVTRPGFLLFILGLALYLALATMANVRRPRGESELVFFALLFSLWVTIIFYKRLLVEHGIGILWQNTPASVLAQYFAQISVLDAVVAVGVLPFIAGMFVMYRHLFTEQQRNVYIVMGLALATGVLVWLRLIKPILGLQVLGVALVILFSFALAELFRYVQKTKFARKMHWIVGGAALIVAISAVPSFFSAQEAVDDALAREEIAALQWLRTNTPEPAVVLAPLEQGHAIAHIAHRGSIADTSFILKEDAVVRVNDISRAFSSPFNTVVVGVMEKYDADYILWTDAARMLSHRDLPAFAADKDCFPLVFEHDSAAVYELRCERKT